MKDLNKYIQESFKIGRNKIVNHDYADLDNLTSYNITLYDSDLDDEEHSNWHEWIMIRNDINDNYNTFLRCKFKSLMEISDENTAEIDLFKNLMELSEEDNFLTHLIQKTITGRDLGYEIRLKGGHLEIYCINSGSQTTYYIYALTKEGQNIFYELENCDFDEDNTVKTLINKLYTNKDNKYIEPIEIY